MPDLIMNSLVSPGASAEGAPSERLNLTIPAGPAGVYRIAQQDDYRDNGRLRFPWRTPIQMSLQARASNTGIPGTWGFGFWNAPFSLGLGFGGSRILPALPNAAWFFFASPPNYLSFRDGPPAQGFLAQTFRSPGIPSLLFAPGVVLLPLLPIRPFARWLRRLVARLIHESAAQVEAKTTEWHDYTIRWKNKEVEFLVDGVRIHQTTVAPAGPLGLVMWVDNQYAAFTPEGRIGYGTLAFDRPAALEIRNLHLDR
jgi:hypothetical protein